MRVLLSGKALAFQARDEGSIPSTRSILLGPFLNRKGPFYCYFSVCLCFSCIRAHLNAVVD